MRENNDFLRNVVSALCMEVLGHRKRTTEKFEILNVGSCYDFFVALLALCAP